MRELLETRRWNVETTDNGIRICRGLHDKSVDCDWEYYTRATDPLLEEMAAALEDLAERANRGRGWLRGEGPSGSDGNWGIFDTTRAEQALQKYRERSNK
jgi:hypothetical protein